MRNIHDEVQSLISPAQTGQVHCARPPDGAQVFTEMQKVQAHLDLLGKTLHCAVKQDEITALSFAGHKALYRPPGLSGPRFLLRHLPTFLTSFTALPLVLRNLLFLQ